MQNQLQKKITRMRYAVLIAMGMLILAEFAFILNQLLDMFWAAIGAGLILAVRLGFYFYQDKKSWQQKVLLAVSVLGILVPVVYFIYQLIFVDSSPLWTALFLSVSFLLPVIFLYYVYSGLKQISEMN